MFVRVKRVNGHDYVYLVENVREAGRHVQRVIKTLGRRDDVDAAGLLDQLADHLVPVLLGGGRRLFEHLDPATGFTVTRVVEGDGVTHLRYATA